MLCRIVCRTPDATKNDGGVISVITSYGATATSSEEFQFKVKLKKLFCLKVNKLFFFILYYHLLLDQVTDDMIVALMQSMLRN